MYMIIFLKCHTSAISLYVTGGSTCLSVCLGYDTAVRWHCKSPSVPPVEARHHHNMTESLITN